MFCRVRLYFDSAVAKGTMKTSLGNDAYKENLHIHEKSISIWRFIFFTYGQVVLLFLQNYVLVFLKYFKLSRLFIDCISAYYSSVLYTLIHLFHRNKITVANTRGSCINNGHN